MFHVNDAVQVIGLTTRFIVTRVNGAEITIRDNRGLMTVRREVLCHAD